MTDKPADSAVKRILLIDSDPEVSAALSAALRDLHGLSCDIAHETLLAAASTVLKASRFDVIILDLELPDSRGVNTFVDVHSLAPSTPILVLAGSENNAHAEAALSKGAYDYLRKNEVQAPLLARSIRYAIERAKLQSELAEVRLREKHAQEISDVQRISQPAGTSITANIYSAAPLRESAAREFAGLAERYGAALDHTLQRRAYKVEEDLIGPALRDVALSLGFLRAGPRDVIDLHTEAMRIKTQNAPWERAQAYLEEGRLTVLELMGNLAGYYRSFYVNPTRKEGLDV